MEPESETEAPSAAFEELSRVAKPRRAAPADAVRPTRAEINLGALRHNLRVVERVLATSSADALRSDVAGKPSTLRSDSDGKPSQKPPAVWAVLKADAYGHGAPATARTFERAGIAGFAVALLEEGIELREAGIRAPILVMGGYYGPDHRGLEAAMEHELTPVVYHAAQIDRLAGIVRQMGGGPTSVHVKVDTGMARLGVRAREADDLFEAVRRTREVRLDGLMSHLACADAVDLRSAKEQARLFDETKVRLHATGLVPRFHHIANSAALFRLPSTRHEAVRPGIALYGVAPSEPGAAEDPMRALRPAMRVRSEIVALRTLEDGERVGYGHTWTAKGRREIATIPMGYADGLSRALSNVGHVLVRGKRAPIAGVVSMDLTAVDVTDVAGVRLGDEAVVLGKQEGPLGTETITAEEIAKHVGTIAWEVLTQISRRVPRFYREP